MLTLTLKTTMVEHHYNWQQNTVYFTYELQIKKVKWIKKSKRFKRFWKFNWIATQTWSQCWCKRQRLQDGTNYCFWKRFFFAFKFFQWRFHFLLHFHYLGFEKIVNLLIKHGGDINAQSIDGKTALHFASQQQGS